MTQKNILGAIIVLLGLIGSESQAAELRHSVRNNSERTPIIVRMEFHSPGPGCRGCWRGIMPMPPQPEGVTQQEWDATWRANPEALAQEKAWKEQIKEHWKKTLGWNEAQANQELRAHWSTGWAECRGPTAGRCQLRFIQIRDLNQNVLAEMRVSRVRQRFLRQIAGGVLIAASITGGTAYALLLAAGGRRATTRAAVETGMAVATAGTRVGLALINSTPNEQVFAYRSTAWIYDEEGLKADVNSHIYVPDNGQEKAEKKEKEKQ